MSSEGLCFGCLTTGHMTRKSRNKFKCFTCWQSHYPIQNSQITRKSTLALLLHFPIDKKKLSHILKTVEHQCLLCYFGRWPNLCDCNNLSEIKAKEQEQYASNDINTCSSLKEEFLCPSTNIGGYKVYHNIRITL